MKAPLRRLFSPRAGAALAVALVTGACSDDGSRATKAAVTTTTASTTTTTTEARLTKEEYIRQGDAICAESATKLEALAPPGEEATDEEIDRFNQQSEALVGEMVARFTALKAPLADKPTADQLNAVLDQMLAKERELTVADQAGDEAAATRADTEAEALSAQFAQVARAYGFVECSREPAPSDQP